MTRPTDELIAALAAGARPVRRLPPPGRRAMVWLAVIAVLAAAGIARFADLQGFSHLMAARGGVLSWIGALATGIAGVVAAAYLSLPDRPRGWAWLPLPFLLLWLGASGAGCFGLPAGSQGDSHRCLVFVLAVGGLLSAFLGWRLSRARPMDGPRVALAGAIGAAGLSAAILPFFHPFAITWLDLGAHALGLVVVVVVNVAIAWLISLRTDRRIG